MNKFFQEVIAEEDAINAEQETIRQRVKKLEHEITALKNNDAFFYRPRKYCKFGDGYYCKFTGNCDHKEITDAPTNIFPLRCFAEKHAREANHE